MSDTSLMEILSSISFLKGIPPEHLERIAAVARVCDFGESTVVFHKRDAADSVYFVVSGKLSLELSPSTMERKHLVDVGPGEMLGWSSLVERSQFAATAVATEPARLIRIDGAGLRAICDNDPKFGYELMRRSLLALAKRLSATWSQLAHLHVSHFLPVAIMIDEDDDE